MNQRVYFRQQAIAHLKACLTVCLAVLFCCSSFAAPAWANQDVQRFVISNQAPAAQSFPAVPVADSCNATKIIPCTYPTLPGGTIEMNFGTGVNRSLDGIVVGGTTYVADTTNFPDGLTNQIVFRRNPGVPFVTPTGGTAPPGGIAGPTVPALGRSQLFYEFEAAAPVNPVVGPTANILPELATSLEVGMRSRAINRGIDNIFNNDQFNSAVPTTPANIGNLEDTRNNIERVDYIINFPGLNVPVASDFGFIVLDRGGNDAFGVAAITAVDPATNRPTAYGPLRPVVPGDFAPALEGEIRIVTIVARDDDLSDGDSRLFRPAHTVGEQAVQGRFFTIANLLQLPDDSPAPTIYGYSIFPGDVDPGDNLVDFLSFPTDTDQLVDGGLDLIAGGLVLTREAAPQIGAAKTNSAPRPVAGQPGFFDFDLELRVTNTGNTVLNNVQMTENLEAAFINGTFTTPPADFNPANSVAVVGTPTINAAGVTGTAPTINPGYTGLAGAPDLFAPGNSFNRNDTAVVTVTVRAELGPAGGATPALDGILVADNQAAVSGTSPGGQTVTDLSQDGRNVDPDGNGNPGDNNDPTRIQIPFPSIGVAKAVSPFRPVAGTTQFDFDFTITVVNSGATVLDNVTLQENLQAALITNAVNRVDSFTIVSPPTLTTTGFTGTPPSVNAAYDGVGNVELLNTPNSFNQGATATVVIPVRAELGSGGPGPLNDGVVIAQNTSTATGTPSGPGVPPGTGPVTDRSQAGTNADPDNDGNPGNNNDPTPIQFPTTTAQLALVKRITNIFRGGAALPVPGITNFNDQPGDNNDTALNAALGGGNQLAGIFQLPPGFALAPDDEVEYTVYLWNSSGGQITQLNLCDELQPPSVLNTNVAFGLDPVGPLGTPTFVDAGGVVAGRSPGAPLDAFCPSAATATSFPIGPPGPTGGLGVGAGGGVVAGPFTVPANQFGAFRFRVRIP